MRIVPVLLLGLLGFCGGLSAAEPASPPVSSTAAGDGLLQRYFAIRTAEIARDSERRLRSAHWSAEAEEYRRQLREMLGIEPLPERTPLNPVVTKTAEHGDFIVENVHFQSSPHLYVTGNLYRPKEVKEPLPAILYVCGHGKVKVGDVSYGNKTHYHHHGVWFARHGYVCLIIDSIQLGEIEALHHGTHNLGMWWWMSRGYTPAGVEAWNCIRALDYLETRPEVDKTRFGVTGRSGGGAYSWYTAAVDPRIQCAVPVAGITDLDDHVVRNCVEGHCDCMYMVNTYRWDYPMLAAMIAPRALLLANTDKDPIFPLEGVVHTYTATRDVFRTLQKPNSLGLEITEGGHKDTQELRVHAMVWFDRFLKKVDRPVLPAELKLLTPQELRVFDKNPSDEINTKIHEQFVPVAKVPDVPGARAEWDSLVRGWKEALVARTFRAWPKGDEVEGIYLKQLSAGESSGAVEKEYEFNSQSPYRLGLRMTAKSESAKAPEAKVVLHILAQSAWEKSPWDAEVTDDAVHFWLAPRGIGPTQWNQDTKKGAHIRRRFYLLGETDDSARTWDVRRAVTAIREILGDRKYSLQIDGEGDASVWALYAALFEEDADEVRLTGLPQSHMTGPALLNVLKTLDVPQAVAALSTEAKVTVVDAAETDPRTAFLKQVEKIGQ